MGDYILSPPHNRRIRPHTRGVMASWDRVLLKTIPTRD